MEQVEKSPLQFFGSRSKEVANQIISTVKRDQPFDCCYDLFSGSGTLFLCAKTAGLAKSYIVNDACPHFANFWRSVASDKYYILAFEYAKLVQEMLNMEQEGREKVFKDMQSTLNVIKYGEDYSFPIVESNVFWASYFAYIVNHCYAGFLIINKDGQLNCELDPHIKDIYSTVDQFFVARVGLLHCDFKGVSIRFTSLDFSTFAPQIESNDAVLLDPPYPDMLDAQERPDGCIYLRTEPKKELHRKLQDFVQSLSSKKIPFVLNYGVVGKDHDQLVQELGGFSHTKIVHRESQERDDDGNPLYVENMYTCYF